MKKIPTAAYSIKVDPSQFHLNTIQDLRFRTFSKLKELLYSQPIADSTDQEIYNLTSKYRDALRQSLNFNSPLHSKFEGFYLELADYVVKFTAAVDQFRIEIEFLDQF